MKLVRTVKIKLDALAKDILPTLQAYTNSFNYICSYGFSNKEKNSINLHKATYLYCKQQFSLPSQLTVSSRVKASEALASVFTKTKHKKYGKCPVSKLCSVRLDARSYTLFLQKKEVSILTVSGRKRFALEIPKYYQNMFGSWQNRSADLVIIKNKVYLHIVFETTIPDVPRTSKTIGIDRGINNIAVSSDNKFFGGKVIKGQVKKYQRLRSSLQKKGTKSAKRHLKKLSKKEKRFRADINHQISKKIISSLNPGDTIALENLTGIRSKRLRKAQRTLLNNWSFYQLEQFITYKGLAKCINVEHVDARYTSQCCSNCGNTDKRNRKTQADFCCKACGFRLNADLNASRNIRNKNSGIYMIPEWESVNTPL